MSYTYRVVPDGGFFNAIRATEFQRVHEKVLSGLTGLPYERLGEPSAFGHLLAETNLDALHLCARHEAIHTGQVAILRRASGTGPLR